MRLIGDPSRHALLRALTEGRMCVTDLARQIGLSQSCTTRHLQALERERVACRAREGKRVLYAVCEEDSLVLELLGIALGARKATAQENARPVRPAPRRSVGASGRPRARRRGPRPSAAEPPDSAIGGDARNPSVPSATRAHAPAARPAAEVVAEAPRPAPARSEIEDYLL